MLTENHLIEAWKGSTYKSVDLHKCSNKKNPQIPNALIHGIHIVIMMFDAYDTKWKDSFGDVTWLILITLLTWHAYHFINVN